MFTSQPYPGGTVRYMYPVNYQNQQPQGMNQNAVSMETAANNQFTTPQQGVPSGTYPAYNSNVVGVSPNVEHYQPNLSQQSYSIVHQPHAPHQTIEQAPSYPYSVHISQPQQPSYGQTQTPAFYSNVATSSSPQVGVISYGLGHQGVYTTTSQPNIQSNSSSVPLQQTMGQPMAIQVSGALPQNGVNGVNALVGQQTQGQYMYSQQGTRNLGQPKPMNTPQQPIFHIQQQNVHPTATGQGVPLVHKNMQMSMQFAGQEQHNQQQGVQATSPQFACTRPIATSATKGVYMDNQTMPGGGVPGVGGVVPGVGGVIGGTGGLVGGASGSNMVAGPPPHVNNIIRPVQMNTGESKDQILCGHSKTF